MTLAIPQASGLPHAPQGFVSGRPNPAERATLRTTFGAVLRAARHHAGLTQAALAARAGTSATLPYQLEAGRVRPSTLVCLALATALAADEQAVRELYDALRSAAGPSLRLPKPGTGRRIPLAVNRYYPDSKTEPRTSDAVYGPHTRVGSVVSVGTGGPQPTVPTLPTPPLGRRRRA
jgi:transcriptional regulator with XRE-family HTH domain